MTDKAQQPEHCVAYCAYIKLLHRPLEDIPCAGMIRKDCEFDTRRPHTPAPDDITSTKGMVQERQTKSPDARYQLCRSEPSKHTCTNCDAITRAATLAENKRVIDAIESLTNVCRWRNWCTNYMKKKCEKPCDFFEHLSVTKVLQILKQEQLG